MVRGSYCSFTISRFHDFTSCRSTPHLPKRLLWVFGALTKSAAESILPPSQGGHGAVWSHSKGHLGSRHHRVVYASALPATTPLFALPWPSGALSGLRCMWVNISRMSVYMYPYSYLLARYRSACYFTIRLNDNPKSHIRCRLSARAIAG